MNNDHLIKAYVDAPTWLALRHRCDSEERTLSQHIRYLIRSDLTAAVIAAKVNNGSSEGQE